MLKHYFHILVIPPEYSIKVQAQIPSALCANYNFIEINNPNEEELPKSINSEFSSPIPNPGDDTVRWMQSMENDEIEDIKIWRDRITQDMWGTFKGILRQGKEAGVEITMMMMMNISLKMDKKLICLFNLFKKIIIFFQKICENTDRRSSC